MTTVIRRVRITGPGEENEMNALKVTIVKVVACGIAAVAVTLVSSYAFVASTAVVRSVAPTHMVASTAGIRLARAAATGLLQ